MTLSALFGRDVRPGQSAPTLDPGLSAATKEKPMKPVDPIEAAIQSQHVGPTPEPRAHPADAKPAAPQAAGPSMLTEDVAALMASLGVGPSRVPGRAYDPDAFIGAIKAVHDKLAEARAIIERNAKAIAKREAEVLARESAVELREAKCAGLESLAGMMRLDIDVPEPPARGLFGGWRK